MIDDSRDRELGMDRRITRRDFLNGVSLAVGGSILAASSGPMFALPGQESAYQPEKDPKYYPPALMGMRGNHEGTYTYAHKLRDGDFWDDAGKAEDTGERYDLVVVGGGISGLAAAYFFRQQVGPKSKILILDNHDDFGGHAKRNEFRVGGRLLLSNGGTQSIENPSDYSDISKRLLKELGIETQRFYKDYDQKLYARLKTACFFDRETFGQDRLVTGMGSTPWPEFVKQAPLSDVARRDIARLYTAKTDYMAGMSREEKRARLATISYADFLTKICGAHPDVLPFFQTYTNDLWAVGIDAVSALACYENPDDYHSMSYAGFDGLDLGEVEGEEPYIFHFPDGNASVARLLVRSLVPGSIPGHSMEDVVTAPCDYARLDDVGAAVRIRLNTTAVRARHVGPSESAKEVEVAYMRGDKLLTVKGTTCVLACYNMMIPYLCPELPGPQKEALHLGVKEPLIYTHVAAQNWMPFHKLGIQQIVSPGGYHSLTKLDFPVSIGEYHFPSKPEEPMVLFMLRTPCKPGLPRRDQYRMGRYELMTTPFPTFERNIRDQLQRMLGSAGFDSARDIAGITVNRWAHGYAYEYNSLSDPGLPLEQRPYVIGRKQFGRISIANSDAAASAYTNAAIDQAYRTIQEQIKNA
ncbi:MAG: FAD/NAD(P)-binding protein [Terriglobales bacterium]